MSQNMSQIKGTISPTESDVGFNKTKETLSKSGVEDSNHMKKKIKLCGMISSLQEETIKLLQQKSILKDLKCEKHEEQMMQDAMRSVNRMYRNAHRIYGYPNKVVEQVKSGKSLLDDKDKIIEETFNFLSNYRETYKRCLHFVDDMCDKAAHKPMIKSVPGSSQGMSASLTFEQILAYNNEVYTSSRRAFDEFEALLYHDLGAYAEEIRESKKGSDQVEKFADVKKSFGEIKSLINHHSMVYGEGIQNEEDNESGEVDMEEINSTKKFYSKIEFLTTAIEKAELAYNEMKTVLFNIINADYS